MKCIGCGKERGMTGMGHWCQDCIGGPVIQEDGVRPFMAAVGCGVKGMTEAYRNDIRSRAVVRHQGDVDHRGVQVRRTERMHGRRVFSLPA